MTHTFPIIPIVPAARPARGRRGFALVLTLVLVVIAGVLLTSVARRSLFGAARVEQEVTELQRRWAVRSLEATLLPQAETILEAAPAGEEAPGRRRLTVQLAGHDYELVLTDEQAKMNVNALLERHGRTGARARMRRLLEAGGRAAPRVSAALRTRRAPESGARSWEPLAGYDQLFASASPAELLGTPDRPGAADRLTFWGDGRVHLHRAPDPVLAEALSGAIPAAAATRLLEARREQPGAGLDALAEAAGVTGQTLRRRVASRVRERSAAHGLWIVARPQPGTGPPRPARVSLAVRARGAGHTAPRWYHRVWDATGEPP